VRQQPVLVVDDKAAAVHGLLRPQLAPCGEVALEVTDEAFGGAAAGGLDLDQPAVPGEGGQQVGRLGVT
jgi:hypothetical protein